MCNENRDVLMYVLKGISYDIKTGRFFRGSGRETFLTVVNGNRVARVGGVVMTAGRFAWEAFYGRAPYGRVTTWNGDMMDMRLLNLRESAPKNIRDEVWMEPLTGLIFRRGGGELFPPGGRRIEYVAGRSWTRNTLWKELRNVSGRTIQVADEAAAGVPAARRLEIRDGLCQDWTGPGPTHGVPRDVGKTTGDTVS